MIAQWHPKQELEAIGAAKPRALKRAVRVADAIRNELSILLLQRIRDPELKDVSISRVVLSDDLRHAKIYYTMLPGSKKSSQVQKRLTKATGFMRTHLARTLNMRFTPDLKFWFDDDLEKVQGIEKLLDDIARERHERDKDT